MDNPTFREVIESIRDVVRQFEKIEGKPWGVEGAMIELSKQMGELSKLVMGAEHYYFPNRDKLDSQYTVNKEKIGDELWDIFYALVRIADYYKIDLVEAHAQECKKAAEWFKDKGNIPV